MNSTWSGPGHKHDHTVLTTRPVTISGTVAWWADYRECRCGHRITDGVTEVPAPRIGDHPDADYGEIPPRRQRLRWPLALEAAPEAYDEPFGPLPGPKEDRP